MSIWGKLAGAAAGLAIGGPIGALLGGVAGHYVIDRDQEQDGPAENQVAFTVGVIALGAKMAKADGVVTMDEVNAFKEVFKVPEGEMKNVARVFNLAKQGADRSSDRQPSGGTGKFAPNRHNQVPQALLLALARA
ncbi:MAG TPA: TerB family tellurite resistance protein [Methyloceanibacter sp.]